MSTLVTLRATVRLGYPVLPATRHPQLHEGVVTLAAASELAPQVYQYLGEATVGTVVGHLMRTLAVGIGEAEYEHAVHCARDPGMKREKGGEPLRGDGQHFDLTFGFEGFGPGLVRQDRLGAKEIAPLMNTQ
nr:hypothetical protein [Actinomadura syzygii]